MSDAIAVVKRTLDGMSLGEKETLESFAQRLYTAQINVYAAYAGHDFRSWENQDLKTQKHWIQSAKERSRKK